MIYLGQYNNLKPLRNTSVGVFLGDDEGTEVLLPNKYVPENLDFEAPIKVFCYLDHEERPVATTLTPLIIRDGFAWLTVVDVNQFGAFLDWGLEKQLLVPYREQLTPMEIGRHYLVHCYLDEKSLRLVASSKLDKFLGKESPQYTKNQQVDLHIWRKSPLGLEVIINEKHKGLVFANDVHQHIALGDKVTGFIKQVREDEKIDVTLKPLGVQGLTNASEILMNALQQHDGFLAIHDGSKPEEIKAF